MKKVQTVAEYVEKIMNKTDDGNKLYLFRGEDNRYERTLPTLYRNEPLMHDSSHYYKMLLSEIGKANYADNSELASSMAELQHYGAKSNLLDVTTNALVALHFALGKVNNKGNDGVVKIYSVKKENIKFDTGHTIALKMATNFMEIEEIWKFYSACEKIKKEIYIKASDLEYCSTEWLLDKSNSSTKDSVKSSVETIIKFMEKLNQIAKTREKLSLPFKIYSDLRSTQFFYSSKSNERIRRQSGAFISPPILDRGDREKIIADIKKIMQREKNFWSDIEYNAPKEEELWDLINRVKNDGYLMNNIDVGTIKKSSYEMEPLAEKFFEILKRIDSLAPNSREKFENIYYEAYLGSMLTEVDKKIKEELECVEICIDRGKISNFKRELKKLGIDSGTIYPDIENISDSILSSSRRIVRDKLYSLWGEEK